MNLIIGIKQKYDNTGTPDDTQQFGPEFFESFSKDDQDIFNEIFGLQSQSNLPPANNVEVLVGSFENETCELKENSHTSKIEKRGNKYLGIKKIFIQWEMAQFCILRHRLSFLGKK